MDFTDFISQIGIESGKYAFPSLPKDMKDFRTEEVAKYGTYAEKNKKVLTEAKEVESFVIEACRFPQWAYVGVLTLTDTKYSKYIIKLYHEAAKIKYYSKEETMLKIMFCKAACEAGEGTKILEDCKKAAEEKPDINAIPFLITAALSKSPTTTKFPLNSNPYFACLQLFYTALNYLNLDVLEAEELLIHAYALSKANRELRPTILEYLGMAQFLNGRDISNFTDLIGNKGMPKVIEQMFDIDAIKCDLPKHLLQWSDKIDDEKTRRIIIDTALSYSECSLSYLREKCNFNPRFDEIFEMTAEMTNASVNGDDVYFGELNFGNQINEKIKYVQEKFLGVKGGI